MGSLRVSQSVCRTRCTAPTRCPSGRSRLCSEKCQATFSPCPSQGFFFGASPRESDGASGQQPHKTMRECVASVGIGEGGRLGYTCLAYQTEDDPMPRQRRRFNGAEKMAILREHLIERVPISEVCERHGLQRTVFYHWQKRLFEEGVAVFEQPRGKRRGSRERRPARSRPLRRSCGPRTRCWPSSWKSTSR